ncbi:MAG: aspartate 1-decarboxylase [Chitinophagaceae bacterium]|nr:MAG: aspartate 1-decarboxylase [Chitinophagaceae bacterium]
MQIQILRAKIHGVEITEANLNYVGSLTLDEELIDAVKLFEFEKIQVVNINNGERIETYLIKGKKGSGVCCLNGPAARKGLPGDKVIILSYGLVELSKADSWFPLKVFPKEGNKLEK